MLFSILLSLFFVQCLTNAKTLKSDYVFNLQYLERLKSATKTGYIDMNQEQFKKFSNVDHSDRNFHLFVLFTSLDPSLGCAACPEAAQTYRQLISIYERKAKKGPLPAFFANIEFRNNMDAYQMTGVDKIPTFVHFGPQAFAPKFLTSGGSNDIAKLVEFITKQSESELNIEEAFKPEPNHNGLVAVVAVILVLGFLLGTKTITVQSIYQNVYLWGTVILAFIIVMLSGHMWVKIRKAPFVGSTNGRDTLYVANALANQFGIESRIVAGLVFGAAVVFTASAFIVSRFEGQNKRQVAALVMSIVYLAAHAGLLKIFAMKAPGYPISHIF